MRPEGGRGRCRAEGRVEADDTNEDENNVAESTVSAYTRANGNSSSSSRHGMAATTVTAATAQRCSAANYAPISCPKSFTLGAAPVFAR
jgi:hypothetical protein